MIYAEITLGTQYLTSIAGKTIEEVIEKIKDYHTMSSFEKEIRIKKGNLAEGLATGWYLKETL